MTLSLALSALALSLLGAAHCAAMCGGFVAAARRPFAMHAGRILSYASIGSAIGAVGSVPYLFASSASVHRALFLVACAVLAWSGLRMAGVRWAGHGNAAWSRVLGARAAAVARRIGTPRTPLQGFLLGALWGWAPCALVYAALPLALVSGSPLSGAVVMAAFGLGTLPVLAGAGWLLARLEQPAVRAWIGAAVVAMAAAAALRAFAPAALPLLCSA